MNSMLCSSSSFVTSVSAFLLQICNRGCCSLELVITALLRICKQQARTDFIVFASCCNSSFNYFQEHFPAVTQPIMVTWGRAVHMVQMTGRGTRSLYCT
jgi:hypothetical protein